MRKRGEIYAAAIVIMVISAATRVSGGEACAASELEALLELKRGLNETYRGIFNTWTGTDCCNTWFGVSCEPESRRVADIYLPGEFERAHRTGYMTGFISSAICRLPRLSSVTISDWKGISGPIPSCITTLPFLRVLDLVGNRISGELPAGLGGLGRMTVLNVANNLISGYIPVSITNMSSLRHLDLRNNRISGEIPRNIGKLKMLSRVLLSRNMISGMIPPSISQIHRLVEIDLALNRLSGPIPETLGRMAVLGTLNLDGNMLIGNIPTSLITSTIGNLNLSQNLLEGAIPDKFDSRSYFMAIDFSHNRLSGSIPKTLCEASFVGHVDLSYNHLCGRIPGESPFDHLEASSFVYNDCLCGKPLEPCKI